MLLALMQRRTCTFEHTTTMMEKKGRNFPYSSTRALFFRCLAAPFRYSCLGVLAPVYCRQCKILCPRAENRIFPLIFWILNINVFVLLFFFFVEFIHLLLRSLTLSLLEYNVLFCFVLEIYILSTKQRSDVFCGKVYVMRALNA